MIWGAGLYLSGPEGHFPAAQDPAERSAPEISAPPVELLVTGPRTLRDGGVWFPEGFVV